MKFKLIFALFNGIVIISFLFVFLMPLFVLGFEYTAGFWSQNWYLILVFVAILALLDGYFVLNWKLFQLLEKEDWKGLAAFLEARIFGKKHFSDQNIRLLCNSWVVQGQALEIMRLEKIIRENRPGLIRRHGLLLGIPYLLKNETQAMLAFFEPLAADTKASDREWLRFNLAFGLLAERRLPEAVAILQELATQKKETIIQLLSLYLLDSQTDAASSDHAKNQFLYCADFRKRFSKSSLVKLIDRSKENLEVIILYKVIMEAVEWMFGGPVASVPAAEVAGSGVPS